AVQERNYEERRHALENVQNAAETARIEQKADAPETSANVGFDVQKATLNDIIRGVMNGVENCLLNRGARMSAQVLAKADLWYNLVTCKRKGEATEKLKP
nr:hypothetical protein [Kiritimatiellia bacterium]